MAHVLSTLIRWLLVLLSIGLCGYWLSVLSHRSSKLIKQVLVIIAIITLAWASASLLISRHYSDIPYVGLAHGWLSSELIIRQLIHIGLYLFSLSPLLIVILVSAIASYRQCWQIHYAKVSSLVSVFIVPITFFIATMTDCGIYLCF